MYVGRFAPSPTGPLHFGSLVAALASFLDARANQGAWLLRIENIDPPREQPGAISAILKSLEAHQLHWDGEVLYQSQRSAAYLDALNLLQSQQLTYRCTCSRQDQHDAMVYNGHCRYLGHGIEKKAAVRINIQQALARCGISSVVEFDDLIQGAQTQKLIEQAGDFVIHRKDGLFAYQLAVVLDDIFQNITHVIRGADLLESTARQILLFRLMGASIPVFGHVPLVLNSEGQKLSKQNRALALDDGEAAKNIFNALEFLQQNPPTELRNATVGVVLAWAVQHWQAGRVRGLP